MTGNTNELIEGSFGFGSIVGNYRWPPDPNSKRDLGIVNSNRIDKRTGLKWSHYKEFVKSKIPGAKASRGNIIINGQRNTWTIRKYPDSIACDDIIGNSRRLYEHTAWKAVYLQLKKLESESDGIQ